MSKFTTLYKRTFRQLLFPYGYQLHNSLFYKELNKEQCFFITAKKETHASWFQVYFGILPYCMDFESELESLSDISDILGFQMTSFMQRLFPTWTHYDAINYFESRFYADSDDEEMTLNSLDNICLDMKKYALPYLHQFVDLQCYYDIQNRNGSWSLASAERYGLSLKLHQYEDAILCVEYQLSDLHRILNSFLQKQERILSGKLNKTDQLLLKKDSNYAAHLSNCISEYIGKIVVCEDIKQKLYNRSVVDLDRIVFETEIKSRDHLRKLLGVKAKS